MTPYERGQRSYDDAIARHGEVGILHVPAIAFGERWLSREDWPGFLDGFLAALDDDQERRGCRSPLPDPELFAAPEWPRCRCGHYDDEHDECAGNACRECVCRSYSAGRKASRKYAVRTLTPAEVAERSLARDPMAQREIAAAATVLRLDRGET